MSLGQFSEALLHVRVRSSRSYSEHFCHRIGSQFLSVLSHTGRTLSQRRLHTYHHSRALPHRRQISSRLFSIVSDACQVCSTFPSLGTAQDKSSRKRQIGCYRRLRTFGCESSSVRTDSRLASHRARLLSKPRSRMPVTDRKSHRFARSQSMEIRATGVQKSCSCSATRKLPQFSFDYSPSKRHKSDHETAGRSKSTRPHLAQYHRQYWLHHGRAKRKPKV